MEIVFLETISLGDDINLDRVSRKNVCVSVLQVPVLVQTRKKNGQICFLRPSLKWMSTMIRFLSAFPATSDLVVTVSVSA